MQKILILYASKQGQAEKIAHAIAGHIFSLGDQITLINISDVDREKPVLTSFDRLVFGSSIYVGKIDKALAQFINANAGVISPMPRSLFLVLMAAATTDTQRREKSLTEIRRNISKQLKVHFPEIEMIAGAIKYSQYNWLVKWMMKRIARKEGGSTDTSRDHEYTDWDQVKAYAQRLASVGSQ